MSSVRNRICLCCMTYRAVGWVRLFTVLVSDHGGRFPGPELVYTRRLSRCWV
jgi:hypothetical protein